MINDSINSIYCTPQFTVWAVTDAGQEGYTTNGIPRYRTEKLPNFTGQIRRKTTKLQNAH
jgi:hypothetical protein